MDDMLPRPMVLIILDGWGCRTSSEANAIAAAHTPVWDKLLQSYPHTTLAASGLAVGLPAQQMGNSEVGHLTIGSGRVIFQDYTRISQAIEQGSFYHNPVLLEAFRNIVHPPHALHLLGLLSPGGVHCHEEHVQACIQLAATHKVENIFIHAILDGRDTPPKSAQLSLEKLQSLCQSCLPTTKARIASIIGRYYAMDRDKRWDRTKAAFELLTEGKALYYFKNPIEALQAAYMRNETDEFVQPTIVGAAATIQNEDVVVFMNFRADRARQLSYALSESSFSAFPRQVVPQLSAFITLTEYAADLKATVAFPAESLKNTLGEYLAQHQCTQLRIAETEKYAHVTFFLNGGRETPFQHEDRILIPSKKVATYDLTPNMSAFEITDKLIEAISQKTYDVIICNYANADMLGHTGNFSAAMQGIEALDTCLGYVLASLKEMGGEALITADHGNAEHMFDVTTKQPHTAHTLERVPFIYVGDRPARITNEQGTLADVAPTLISLLGLPKPPQMTGTSLIQLL